MTGSFSAQDYAAAARAALPRGRVWPGVPESTQGKLLLALAQSLARVDVAAVQLLADARPDTTLNLLEEWESSLGLPDPCVGPNPTVEQRRGQVVARFGGVGGQSRAFFVEYAKALGYTIQITNHAPFRAGQSQAGDRVGAPEWVFVWTVIVTDAANLTDSSFFRAGHGRAGDPLRSGAYTTAVLQCEFEHLKAAETNVLFPD